MLVICSVKAGHSKGMEEDDPWQSSNKRVNEPNCTQKEKKTQNNRTARGQKQIRKPK